MSAARMAMAWSGLRREEGRGRGWERKGSKGAREGGVGGGTGRQGEDERREDGGIERMPVRLETEKKMKGVRLWIRFECFKLNHQIWAEEEETN